jgi:hypothetical protein
MDSYISAIDISQKKVLSSSGSSGEAFGLIAYNKVTGSLYLGEMGTSPASLASYSFNEASNQFIRNQFINDLGSNGLGLAVSPDGKHLAFCADSGNGSGYNVFDIDASNLSNKFGSWNTDAYPTAGSFTLDSKNVILSNGSQVKIFNVQNHTLLKTFNVYADGSSSVVFSRGGKLAFTSGSTNVTCFASGIQQSLLKGDFDFSGSVTIIELASLSKGYNIKSSSIDSWNPELDLNSDGIIDIFDLVLLSKNMYARGTFRLS